MTSLKAASRLVLSASLVLAAFAGRATAREGGNPNPQVVPPSPEYANLSARWWQWALDQPVTPDDPETTNPLVDTTGKAARNGQPDDVFFLCGLLAFDSGLDATAERTVTVPRGRRLFFPLLNSEQDNVGVSPPMTVAQLRKAAALGATQVTSLFATIDGVELQDLSSYRVISPVFSYKLPANQAAAGRESIVHYLTGGAVTITGVQKPAVGDGFYLLLKPLNPGRHTIHFGGTSETTDGDGNPAAFRLDITYHITVPPRIEGRGPACRNDDKYCARQVRGSSSPRRHDESRARPAMLHARLGSALIDPRKTSRGMGPVAEDAAGPSRREKSPGSPRTPNYPEVRRWRCPPSALPAASNSCWT